MLTAFVAVPIGVLSALVGLEMLSENTETALWLLAVSAISLAIGFHSFFSRNGV